MPRSLGLLFLVVAACKTTETPPPAQAAPPKQEEAKPAPAPEPKLEAPKVRLPDGARPLGYELSLRVVPGEPTFTGEVTIELELDRAVDVLWLNARDLTAQAAELTVGTAKVAAATKPGGEHFLAVVPATPVGPGKATLRIRYTGALSETETSGLFQLKEGGEQYAVTQFEPIGARRAFPCFDEPGFKVPWHLTLHVKKEHAAFHNTPVEREQDEAGGMKAVTFAKTKPLPSYLVALAVGPFETVDAGTWGKNKTRVRIITPRGKTADAKYAVESTGPVLEQLEAYFGIPYPFEKLDELAMPVNFGAMEHPGLVTYGSQLLLMAPEKDTIARQRLYASIAAHELAHMWFGDLVTMAWWDDVWLNEAFATWMSSKIIEGWKPAWDEVVDRAGGRGGALSTDALVSARRIRQPIEAMDDITNAFDGITYGKGAAVIEMFEAWVGDDVFQKGVKRHLEAHAFGNATAAQFLDAISKEAGKDVATPFNTFLDQAGAPRVAMALVCAKGEAPRLELSQRRQLPVGSKGDPNQVWQVPLCVRTSTAGKERRACTLLTAATGTLPLEGKACPDWVMPNDGVRGYYRADLKGTADLLGLLEKAGPKLTVAERVGLLDDLEALVGSGDVELGVALAAIPLALKEDNRHLLAAAQGLASQLRGDLLPEALRPKYEAFVRATFGARAAKLGLTVGAKEDEDTRLARPWLVGMVAVDGKEPALRKQSLALAKAWLTDRKAIHPDLVGTVLGIAADTGDAALHEALVNAVKAEQDRTDRGRMLGALASFRDPAQVKAQLALALDPKVDAREAMRVLWGASGDYRTRELALDWLKQHWDPLVARLPEDSGAYLVWTGAGVCDAKKRDEVKAYFDGRSTKFLGGPRELDQALEEIDLCVAWRARHQPSAAAFMERWKPGVALKAPK